MPGRPEVHCVLVRILSKGIVPITATRRCCCLLKSSTWMPGRPEVFCVLFLILSKAIVPISATRRCCSFLKIIYLEAREAWRILCACPNLFQGDSSNICHQAVLLLPKNQLPGFPGGLKYSVSSSTSPASPPGR
jgi:hypothetical protein